MTRAAIEEFGSPKLQTRMRHINTAYQRAGSAFVGSGSLWVLDSLCPSPTWYVSTNLEYYTRISVHIYPLGQQHPLLQKQDLLQPFGVLYKGNIKSF